ncbi:hypothetical protein [Bacillus sp. AFS041924]|uniref:hypothetical protein n=1 Tax=Bacillus sp. AFS041924 TaxID=2033503 RepID=UPI000BFDCDD3|nr:hypothetical protein [Bacillus sp. AFS041924]PGS48415.1 hypothetical protein COC46_18160 [Bacillus sp. AFS041924]
MKKRLIISILIILVIVLVYFKYPRNLAEDLQLKNEIESVIHNQKNTELDFAKITNFKWDKMIIVTPYLNFKDQLRENNINGNVKLNSSIEWNDSIYLVVFTKNNKIVSYVNYERKNGDFSFNRPLNLGISQKNAKFKIDRENEVIRLVLK